MKKGLYLSVICASMLYSAETHLETISVEAPIEAEVFKDVRGEDIKSADVAEALMRQSPSVSLVRRSGISNDVIVRGQKKDNINVTIDGAKVCGACPNRMDPPISHVLANNIDTIVMDEGPFSVEDFGVLSADIDIVTLKPKKELSGDVSLNFGSWGYQKASAYASAGVDNFRFLFGISAEKGGQYEDGDGNNFYEQVNNYIAHNLNGNADHDKKLKSQAYQPQYSDMDAFAKKTGMAKLFWDITDTQQVRLSYIGNRSDDILYPTSPMDALYDDSNLYNIEYTAKDLGAYSKSLDLQVYKSDVEHPMSNDYRMASKTSRMENALTTDMTGAKITNSFERENHAVKVGLDYSLRNWDGAYYGFNEKYIGASIPDVDTKNIGLFVEDGITLNKFKITLGARYDDTTVEPNIGNYQENDYNALSGFLLGTYQSDESTKLFAGIGRSSRVPDPRELYSLAKDGLMLGTPDLEQTTNTEFDIGAEKQFEKSLLKAKLFYSKLGDFIFYNSDNTKNMFENMDATLYGLEISGSYFVTDTLYIDSALAFQKGEKEDPLTGQTETNMPEIPPMKFIVALNYEYDATAKLKAEAVAASRWDDVDSQNGEQVLAGWGVINLKGSKIFKDAYELTLGVDNLFDKTYAISNTYEDLTLITGGGYQMLMNEPGRYVYANLSYKF